MMQETYSLIYNLFILREQRLRRRGKETFQKNVMENIISHTCFQNKKQKPFIYLFFRRNTKNNVLLRSCQTN